MVHKSSISTDAREFAVQLLRNQVKKRVYPVHRLDRKTSGALLFALNPEVNSLMQKKFADKQITKKYIAIVRGWTTDEETINYAIKNERGKLQEAISHYQTLQRTEIPVPSFRHPTSRYSLVELTPETGRYHQLRKHMKHIFHPIIGDRQHGCNKQNKIWKERFGLHEMLLHARSLSFAHPVTQKETFIEATYSENFLKMRKMMFENEWNMNHPGNCGSGADFQN